MDQFEQIPSGDHLLYTDTIFHPILVLQRRHYNAKNRLCKKKTNLSSLRVIIVASCSLRVMLVESFAC